MRINPIRPMLISAAIAAVLWAGVPAIAQDTMQSPPAQPDAMQPAPAPSEPMQSQPMQSQPMQSGPQGDMPGNMAPPASDAMNKTYPVCRGGMTDNCQNPGEGGAPGRSRASDTKGGSPAHHKMHRRHN